MAQSLVPDVAALSEPTSDQEFIAELDRLGPSWVRADLERVGTIAPHKKNAAWVWLYGKEAEERVRRERERTNEAQHAINAARSAARWTMWAALAAAAAVILPLFEIKHFAAIQQATCVEWLNFVGLAINAIGAGMLIFFTAPGLDVTADGRSLLTWLNEPPPEDRARNVRK
jgi:hypothetical protein